MNSVQSFSCYVINLENDTKRYLHIKDRLTSTGIAFQRYNAVNGKSFSEEDLALYYDAKEAERLSAPLKLSELGCALSHMNIYKNILSEKTAFTLILEDDIDFDTDFKKIIEKQIKERQAGKHSWEYLSFDYYAYGFGFLKLWYPGVKSIYKIKPDYLSKLIFLIKTVAKFFFIILITLLEEVQKKTVRKGIIYPLHQTYFAGAYLITYEGAKKMVEVHDRIIYTADRLPNIARAQKKLKFYIYTPLSVNQLKNTFTSNIHEE